MERWKDLILTDKPYYIEVPLDLRSVPDNEKDAAINISVLKELFLNYKINENALSVEEIELVDRRKRYFLRIPSNGARTI